VDETTVNWVLRIVAFIGIGLFLWSVAGSLEQIAKALTRMAKAAEKPAERPPDSPQP
jgi:hypothetical protein